MILPYLRSLAAKWDRYKAFHVTDGSLYCVGKFTQFSTGELIVGRRHLKPSERKHYKDYNVSLVSTTDDKCPPLYLSPDADKPVTKASLTTGGGQTLLIDYDTRKVVNLRGKGDLDIPKHLRSVAYAYFPGAGLPPVGHPIKLSEVVISKEEREHLKSLQRSCRAWAALSELAPRRWTWDKKIIDGVEVPVAPAKHKRLLGVEFRDLPDYDRAQIAWHRVKIERTVRTALCLWVK